MTPDVNIQQHAEDPKQQVVTFAPPVASWSFRDDHSLDELWLELIQGSSALAMEHGDADFDEELAGKMRKRITEILTYWSSQGWVSFEPQEQVEQPTG